MSCKGRCQPYRAIKPFGQSRYKNGQKMCSICEIFLNWDGKHCPCCNYTLRTKPKGTKTRHNLMMVKQDKKFFTKFKKPK